MARLFAPAALLAVVVAVLVIFAGTGDPEPDSGSAGATTTESTSSREEEQAETPAPAETTETVPEGGGETYVIQSGDTLAGIASANDTTVEALLEANPDINPSALRVGDELQLGGG